jgi:hypothetical protein
MNFQLIEELIKVRHAYEQQMREVAANRNRKTLTIICEQIRFICSYPEIGEQINAVRPRQKIFLTQNEITL